MAEYVTEGGNQRMKPEEKEIILSMARNDLSSTKTSKELHRHRNTVIYWIEKMKKDTGLDCRKFYDLVKLVGMVEDGDTQD
jgi:sugar diacid utilization regulator